MRILHVISQKPSFTGSGTFYNALIFQSIKHGISPYLFYSVSSRDENIFFDGLARSTELLRFESDEIPYPVPGMSDVMPYPSTVFSAMSDDELALYFSVLRAGINKAVLLFRPEIIWTHHLWVVSSIVKELSIDIPVIAFCHGSDLLQSKKSPAIFNLIKKNLEKIELTISTSPEQNAEISRQLKLPEIVHLGNGIREDIFHFKKGYYKKAPFLKLAYAGKISMEKGVHCLVSAVKMLLDEGIAVQLNLYGNGSETELAAITTLAKGYENSIHFLGMVTQEELSFRLNDSDIFILPSFYEGLGLVVIEAIACGCRTIITDLPNLSAVLPDELFETGITSKVPLPDMNSGLALQDLTSFCITLKEQIELYAKLETDQRTREHISKSVRDFTFKSMFEKLIEVSKCIINERTNFR
jgi:glycosyltransferase involved in cell wall biosynthesis